MSRIALVVWLSLLAITATHAQDDEGAKTAKTSPGVPTGGVKTLSGMSILGNDEAPKSLVIVPWKTSEIGAGIGLGNLLDGRSRPVDKEVFMRELKYYEIRSEK